MSPHVVMPFVLPVVPPIGKPVSRELVVMIDGIEKHNSVINLSKFTVIVTAPVGSIVDVRSRTADAAGNWSEWSELSVKALDIFPPPAPPYPELDYSQVAETEAEADSLEIREETPVV